MICCNKEVEVVHNVTHKIGDETMAGVGIVCHICDRRSTGKDEKEAIVNYGETTKIQVKQPERGEAMNNNRNTQIARYNPASLANDMRNTDLSVVVSPLFSGNQTAMDRLLQNNIERYPLSLKGKAWDKIWASTIGQESIKHEIENALLLGAELGKTGDLVPYGEVCQFIPSVEAYEFALTFGNNAPFEEITIELIYQDDDWKTGTKNGEFFIENVHGKDRNKVSHVAVYGTLRQTGKIVGEMYDASRLLEKAEAHSAPYKKYMTFMRAYEFAKSEGKVNTDRNGRKSFIYYEESGGKSSDKYWPKTVDAFRAAESAGSLKRDSKGEYLSELLPKKAGGTWEKKTYRHEIDGQAVEKVIFPDELSNPYVGADQPEMLRKSAGKTFLRKYEKTRNTAAAMGEIRTHNEAVGRSMDMADDILDGDFE